MKNYQFADIILPLAVKGKFTYRVPEKWIEKIKPGSRVTVQFGKNMIYSGIVFRMHNEKPEVDELKIISDVIDSTPVVSELQLKFWKWISDYYMCNIGEVMKAALPSDSYKPREEAFIILSKKYSDRDLNNILDNLSKAPRQYEILSAYIRLTGYTAGADLFPVKKSLLLKETGSSPAPVNILEEKGIITSVYLEVDRLSNNKGEHEPLNILSKEQSDVYRSLTDQFKVKDIALLHGVTSSGKTEIYIHLIKEVLKLGKQVLYLLPEIALTTQIITRLTKHFGSDTAVYHSGLNDAEKVEIWQRVATDETGKSFKLILGVRSSVFLPFHDLGLVIVDEEHDISYKQQDPAPRYQARDSAIVLANLHGAKTLLGSATPSIESYYNAIKGKYGLAVLNERYCKTKLPETIVANTREAYRKKRMVSHFTPELLYAIDEALKNKEQVILFQNRRGFSPYIECLECGWIPVCIQCAVKLTYHKGLKRLVCHYCGYKEVLPAECISCRSADLTTRGFGTEKIEDEVKIVFPAALVARLDHDTTRNTNSFIRVINAFKNHQIDILVGTQMISKGLDFENLTVVGILNADNQLNFPDFRAYERSFQLLEQVSGRAGRREKTGRVIIQTSDPANRIIQYVLRHDYLNMYNNQVEERETFGYPPFSRLIRISIRHKDRSALNNFSGSLGAELRKNFGKRVLGPESPVITKIQMWHIKTILIKIERGKPVTQAKDLIRESIEKIEKLKGASSLKISVDVDPY